MFNKVLERYKTALSKLYRRAYKAEQGSLTANQQKGIAYYRAAIQTLETLAAQPKPEWVDLVFEKRLY